MNRKRERKHVNLKISACASTALLQQKRKGEITTKAGIEAEIKPQRSKNAMAARAYMRVAKQVQSQN